ncbi:MAG TPA: ComEC/Rec2 family competence protein [Dehalococcoidia bacterium]|nr:ComEC/Rec2 family competence protein [Dehalococcoidia bacterium]
MTLVIVACAWLAGVAYAAAGGNEATLPAWSIAAGAMAAAATARSPRFAIVGAACAVLFWGGAWRYEAATRPDEADIARLNDGRAVTIRGVVIDEPVVRNGAQRFRVEVTDVRGPGGWRASSGRALVRVPLYPRFAYGDAVEATGELETPPSLEAFDYRAYLQRQGVVSVMDFPRVRRVGSGGGNRVVRTFVEARGALGRGIERTLPEPEAAFAEGLLLGRRSGLSDGLAQAFNDTGTSHLIAISGYNVTLVAGLAIGAMAWLIGRRPAGVATLGVIAAYTMLTGASPSVVRAAIMGGLYVGAGLLGRPGSAGPAIAAAAAGMAGAEPSVVHDPSYQLSFAATAAVIWLAPAFERQAWARLGGPLRGSDAARLFVVEPAAVTTAATVATAPLIALHFDRFSLISIPANILVLPLFPLALGASLVAAVGGLIPGAAPVLAWPTWIPLRAMTLAVETLARMPGATVAASGFGAGHAGVALVSVAGAAWWIGARTSPGAAGDGPGLAPLVWRLARRTFAPSPAPWATATLAFAALAVGWPAVRADSPPTLTLTALDVGQGDALLIETPSGAQALIDGGPDGAVLAELGRILGPGDRDIDLVALTHPQEDHVAGLIETLERYEVRTIVFGPGSADTGAARAWRRAVRVEGADVRPLAAPASIFLDGVRLDVLWPPPDIDGENLNATSLVVRVRYGDVTMLLTGDIQAETEAALLASGLDLRADVLKVAHHGSRTSTTQPFLDAVRPSVAIISVGAGNRFGHPAPEVVERLEASGARVYRTDEDGRVVIETDGERVWVR